MGNKATNDPYPKTLGYSARKLLQLTGVQSDGFVVVPLKKDGLQNQLDADFILGRFKKSQRTYPRRLKLKCLRCFRHLICFAPAIV